jgi:hypothetical protein
MQKSQLEQYHSFLNGYIDKLTIVSREIYPFGTPTFSSANKEKQINIMRNLSDVIKKQKQWIAEKNMPLDEVLDNIENIVKRKEEELTKSLLEWLQEPK